MTRHTSRTSRPAARTIAALASVTAAGIALAGCAGLPRPAAASGPRTEVAHAVSDAVHGLRFETSGDVTVQLGEVPGLTVRAPESVHERLTVAEDDGTLVLGSRGPGIWAAKVDYVLTVRSFDALVLEGAGDVTADFSSADAVSIRVDGVGDVRATGVDATSVAVSVGGTGSVRIAGTAERGELGVDGAGDVKAADLVLRRASADISGAGDIEVHATDALDASISGLGDIHVSGSPHITRDVSGLGDIVAA